MLVSLVTGLDWLYKISITCFAASYLVALALEFSRVFFSAKFRPLIRLGFAAAGLFAHTVYLIWQGKLELGSSGIWLNSWFGWCLATSWILAVAYLWLSIRKSDSMIGLFLLPLVLGLIGLGIQIGSNDVFAAGRAKSLWGFVHGMALLLGTATIGLGFVFGIVYLLQARRLKKRIVPSKVLRLPSLEWLENVCETLLITSTILLAVGLLSGIALNLANRAEQDAAFRGTIAWTDPVIWTSGILFLWLLVVTIFNMFYQPARRGRKVAYLVVTSFIFLAFEIGVVLWSGHAVDPSQAVLDDHKNHHPIVRRSS